MDLIPVTSLHNMNVDTMENSDLAFCTYHEDGTSIQQTAYSATCIKHMKILAVYLRCHSRL